MALTTSGMRPRAEMLPPPLVAGSRLLAVLCRGWWQPVDSPGAVRLVCAGIGADGMVGTRWGRPDSPDEF
eukprot:3612705-Amphidinium_carterae.1